MVREGWGEIIVVDNFSTDDTCKVAQTFLSVDHAQAGMPVLPSRDAIRVIQKGPERSAQRNEGWRQARGEYVFFVDADMRVPEETLREIQGKIAVERPLRTAHCSPLTAHRSPLTDAFFVREVRIGEGWWTRVRNFERSFYDATCIDALRVIRRSLLEQVGGYDETMHACEDWDLDRRLLQLTKNVAVTEGYLLHDERRLTFVRHIRKKVYYSGNFSLYLGKWGHDATTRKQFGFRYRFFGIFFEKGKWKRAITHPHYMVAIWFERVCVGVVYLTRRS